METVFYKIVKPIVKGLFYVLYRPTIVGIENIPTKGPVVLAGNHTKQLDPIMLVAVSKRQIHFLAKIELFKGITKPIVKGMGAIPVNRKAHDGKALKSAIECLEKGYCIGIFPEGTINRTDDIIMPFKKGAIKMSKQAEASLVPFVITGQYRLFKKSIKIEFLKARKVKEDIDLENEKLMNDIKKVLIKSR